MFKPTEHSQPAIVCNQITLCQTFQQNPDVHSREKPQPLAEAINDYLYHLRASGRAHSTIACYRGYLERLGQFLGPRQVAPISAAELERYVVKLREGGEIRSEVTLNKIKSVYRSFFRWVRNTDRSKHDPAANLSLAQATSPPTIPITAEEVDVLLATIRNTKSSRAARDEVLFAIYAFAGLRRSEALSLRNVDYDSALRLLTLPHTKGGGCRVQPVPAILAGTMERYVDGIDRAPNKQPFFLFSGLHPQAPLSARQAQARFCDWKAKAGIRNSLTIHSFRAGFATRLYRETGDLWLVGRSLGHRNLGTTQRYVETDVSDIREAMERAFCAD